MRFQGIFLISTILIVFTQCKTPEKKNSETQFYSFDKTKIAYTDEGNGEAVMLIHGFIMNGSNWNKTVSKKVHY